MTRCAQCIITDVSRSFEVPRSEIMSQSRSRTTVRARQAIMHMLRSERGLSLMEIARMVRRTDHQTIIHGLRMVERKLGEDPAFAAMYREALQ